MRVKLRMPARPIPVPVAQGPIRPIPHIPTAYELALKVILWRDARSAGHARCVAHAVNVWPA